MLIRRYRHRLLATSLLALPCALHPLSAQETGPDDQDASAAAADPSAQPAEGDDAIVVTGSLIRNPNLELSTPVNVTTADTIELKQSNVAEEVLRELPGVVPSIGSAVNNGNNGASRVDLRGLGSNRNIVLLDGKRIVPDDSTGRVDLNSIPLALIRRVDALTGAAVTTYGADAVTGVVNFITRDDFSGVEVAASQQLTELGDGSVLRIDATVGANFDDGRGNAVLSIGYQEADPVYQGARPFSVSAIDSYSGAVSGSGTAVPARFSGTRPLITGTTNPNLDPTVANGGLRAVTPSGAAVSAFTPFNFNPYNLFQTPFQRFNVFGSGRFAVSDDIEVYARGMYSKNTVTTIVAPSGAFGTPVNINLNNPFLPATLRNQFCAFDVNPNEAIYTPRFSQAECDAAALASGPGDPRYRVTGTNGFVAFDLNGDGVVEAGEGYNPNPGLTVNRRSVEFGPRIGEFKANFFDYRIGARGGLTDTLNWDINGSYGENDNTLTQSNYILASRLRQGLLVNGTRDNPVCQSTANGCVPIDIFSVDAAAPFKGEIALAARDFLTAASSAFRGGRLGQVQGVVSGDLGFSLPSATQPFAMAVGAEYRNYSAYQAADFLSKQAGELGGAGGAILEFDGGYEVYEGFAELIAPLVEDRPFFESLTLEAGVRYSDYSIDAPDSPGFDTWTYKVGGSWEPGSWLKIRGNYSRAARAPNIFELFNPPNTVLTNLAVDPCAGSAPTTNANLRAICLAQGAPLGTIGSINNPTAAQANITAAGNLSLKPEKADTFTIGAVLQPDFVPGFNVSVDYYNITVKDAIGAPLPGDLIAACFGNVTAASAADPACTVIRRNPLTGALDGDPSITPGLFAQQSNLGRLKTDGIDVLMNYRTNLDFAVLNLSFVGNWTNSSRFKASPSAIDRECVGYYSVNCSFTGSIQPEFQFSQRSTLTFDDVDLSLLWRFVDAVEFEPAQFADDLAAAVAAGTSPTTGCPDPEGADPNGCVVDPEFRRIDAEHYFDLTGRWSVTDNFVFTVTVQNLLDNKPKSVGNTIGSTTYNSGNTYPSTYDALGRRYAVSAKLRF